MQRLLALTALLEAATGVALVMAPSKVAGLLLGAGLTGPALALGRMGGLGLLALGVAVWPGRDARSGEGRALRAMLTYNARVALHLRYVSACGDWVGPLLWPAASPHAVLSSLLVRAYGAAGGPRPAAP